MGRRIATFVSLTALLLSYIAPAAAKNDPNGIPGRRTGGGTRWTVPNPKQTISLRNKLSAMTFASRNHLPMDLKLKALFGGLSSGSKHC